MRKVTMLKKGMCVCDGTEVVPPMIIGEHYGRFVIEGITVRDKSKDIHISKFIVVRSTLNNRISIVSPNRLNNLSKQKLNMNNVRRYAFKENCSFTEFDAWRISKEWEFNERLDEPYKKTIQEFADKYSTSVLTVSNLVNGKTYRGMFELLKTGELKVEDLRRYKRGAGTNSKIDISKGIIYSLKMAIRAVAKNIGVNVTKRLKEFEAYPDAPYPEGVTSSKVLDYNNTVIDNLIGYLIEIISKERLR